MLARPSVSPATSASAASAASAPSSSGAVAVKEKAWDMGRYSTLSPVHFAAKAYLSAASVMILSVGLTDPWPAGVSIRIRFGPSPASAFWSAAVYLKDTKRGGWGRRVVVS